MTVKTINASSDHELLRTDPAAEYSFAAMKRKRIFARR